MNEVAGQPGQSTDKIRNIVEGRLERARNPSSRMEAKLKAAEEKIKQMEHEKRENEKRSTTYKLKDMKRSF